MEEIGVYVGLYSSCTMFVALEDLPILKFIDSPFGGCIYKKIIVLL